MSFPEAVEALANHVGIPVPKEVVAGGRQFEDQQDLLDILQEAATYYRRQLRDHPQAGAAADYLKGRGLSGEVAARFGLGFAPDGWDNLLRALGTDEVRRKHLQQAGLLAAKDGGGHYDRFPVIASCFRSMTIAAALSDSVVAYLARVNPNI